MENKKNVTLSLDDPSIELLKAQAESLGMNASKYIRLLVYALDEKPELLTRTKKGALTFRCGSGTE